MKEKVTTFFKNNYHSIVMGVMFGLSALHIYDQRSSKEFYDLIANEAMVSVWIFNWWMVIQFNKINEKHQEELTELWRNECQRLYAVIEEYHRIVRKSKNNTTNI